MPSHRKQVRQVISSASDSDNPAWRTVLPTGSSLHRRMVGANQQLPGAQPVHQVSNGATIERERVIEEASRGRVRRYTRWGSLNRRLFVPLAAPEELGPRQHQREAAAAMA